MIGCDFDPAFVFRGALRQNDYTRDRQALAEKTIADCIWERRMGNDRCRDGAGVVR